MGRWPTSIARTNAIKKSQIIKKQKQHLLQHCLFMLGVRRPQILGVDRCKAVNSKINVSGLGSSVWFVSEI